MSKTIKIVDAEPGSGKSSAAIKFIGANKGRKFIYVTPYIKEVERVQKACHMKQPKKYSASTPKIIDLKRLLNKGENIITTHAMFSCFDDEVCDLCRAFEYTLIMDEVHDVIASYPIAKQDLQVMMENYAERQEDGILKWKDGMRATKKYEQEKRLCDLGSLASYSDSSLLWLFPTKVFESFKETYVLTYMFNAQLQKYYYDFFGMEYEYLYVKGDRPSNYEFTSEPQDYKSKYNYKRLITLVDDDRLNAIGNGQFSLSKGWYDRNSKNALMTQLKNNLINFFNNKKVLFDYEAGEYVPSSSAYDLWTTFAQYKGELAGKGYTRGYIASNMRATNEYRHRCVVAYTINKYLNPVVSNFFSANGIEVDEDAYATSEMLQFLWRSAIRDGRPVTLYIPSERMRNLLYSWVMTYNN